MGLLPPPPPREAVAFAIEEEEEEETLVCDDDFDFQVKETAKQFSCLHLRISNRHE